MLIYILIYISIGVLWNKFLCWTSDKYTDHWNNKWDFNIKCLALFGWPIWMFIWLLRGLFMVIGGKKE